MKAIQVLADREGRPLVWREAEDPQPRSDEVLVDIHATSLNRADLMQRAGGYPPPPGASDILGLDMAGKIASVGADILLPGHGKAIKGADAIRERCQVTAATLCAIVDQTLAGLNAGKNHEEILATIKIPEELAKHWYVDPLYDRPEFIARNLIRKYGGWWNGYSAELMPAPMPQRAREIIELAGGVGPLIARAKELKETDPAMACHLAEWVAVGAPESREAQECAIEVFEARAEDEIALMARGIYNHAVRRSEEAIERIDEKQAS